MQDIIRISDINAYEIAPYVSFREAQLLHFYEPEGGIFIAESPKVIERAIAAGCVPESFLMEERTCEAMREIWDKFPEAKIYVGREEELSKITGFKLTRGMLSAMRRPVLPKASELAGFAGRVVVLDNIENPTNVGAIFRSAAALGMDAVFLTPGSADPLYRRASRVSMGTVFQIPWTYIESVDELKELGYKTTALALRNNTIDIASPVLREIDKLALIMGNEGDGLPESTLEKCDYTVKIPMYHEVDSLNVAAAAAVAFYVLK